MKPFYQRLVHCLEAGNLTMSDLARWLDRSPATVRSWIEKKTEMPAGPFGDRQRLLSLLAKLEGQIRDRRGFPVPRLGWRDRWKHLEEAKSAKS